MYIHNRQSSRYLPPPLPQLLLYTQTSDPVHLSNHLTYWFVIAIALNEDIIFPGYYQGKGAWTAEAYVIESIVLMYISSGHGELADESALISIVIITWRGAIY